ncbi:MAG: DUF805 domain-containing protein [Deltaproteobacteria bacterium]|nr:DUF805 domain-containing protein [Deltaproteobacteria bacterium]
MDSYFKAWSNFAKFSGRASRSEFWSFCLINNIILFLTIATKMETLFVLFGLITTIPFLSVGVRRLHDGNHSGWLLLIQVIPIIGLIILFVALIGGSDIGENRFGPNPNNAAFGEKVANLNRSGVKDPDRYLKLEKLSRLKEQGVITEVEFD